MKILQLKNPNFEAIVDDEDYERLSIFNWCINLYKGRPSFIFTHVKRVRKIALTNMIMNRHGIMFDHIDRNPLNNQKSNLREATSQLNSFNTSKQLNTSSKYKGVCRFKGSKIWVAYIMCNGERIHLGSFLTEEAAAKAYDAKAIELFKQFANLNFK